MEDILKKFYVILVGYFLLTIPGSYLIKQLLNKFSGSNENLGINKAGKIIGYLERILVLTFILSNHLAGISAIFVAKSIFRFKKMEQEHSEYYLIGTFSSITLAVILGLLIRKLIRGIG